MCRSRLRKKSLNPLLIGAVLPTGFVSCGNRPCRILLVSIPFSSGQSFQRLPVRMPVRLPVRVSIPFSSGQSFQHLRYLHGTGKGRNVSIPFSSGQSFQHFPTTCGTSTTCYCLNPLLIGAVLPTRHTFCRTVALSRLNPLLIGAVLPTSSLRRSMFVTFTSQSPSHRGSPSNVGGGGGIKDRLASLNPLLIGAVLPTVIDKFSKSDRKVSIPFSSGQSFQRRPHDRDRPERGTNVSIPFSSGQSFQPATG